MREKMKEFDLQKQQLKGLATKLLQTEEFHAQIKAMNMHLQDTLSMAQKQKNEVRKHTHFLRTQEKIMILIIGVLK